jgi:deoxyribodipyrimidine photo-lyase
MNDKIHIFWFRRDLRLNDNHGLFVALNSGLKVLPLFIFDTGILSKLKHPDDSRVSFIYDNLKQIDHQLREYGSSLLVRHGKPIDVFSKLIEEFRIRGVFVNTDFEPYGLERDALIHQLFKSKGLEFTSYTDHVVFEPTEILKADGSPYTMYTPFSVRWKERLRAKSIPTYASESLMHNFQPLNERFPTLDQIGFAQTTIPAPVLNIDRQTLIQYQELRNLPFPGSTTYSGVYLRFGTISIRQLVAEALKYSETFLNELIWREFFMQILVHFPHVVNNNFNPRYKRMVWRNDPHDYELWCSGMTGFPMVDAGMRQLNQTGFMHNRVRMITAGFLTKHLLIDWRWGEAYFAEKLLDYELASNNGNWQWAAGTGCDAAPYFRVFNPMEQARKFDPEQLYVRKWIPEIDSPSYPAPMVDHKSARERAIKTYKEALSG